MRLVVFAAGIVLALQFPVAAQPASSSNPYGDVPAGAGSLADVKVLSGGAMQPALAELIPKFEQASGHKVVIEYGGAGAMADRIQRGEAADVAIVTPAQIDALEKQGKIVPRSRTDLAKVGIALFVRKGASKPNIGSVDAFRSALLAAKSITYPAPGGGSPAGVYIPSMLERLGIVDQINAKANLNFKQPSDRFAAVAAGEVELGLSQMTEVIAAPNVDLVGPLPAAIQSFTSFSGAITTSSQQPQSARAFLRFISSPSAMSMMKAKGFEI